MLKYLINTENLLKLIKNHYTNEGFDTFVNIRPVIIDNHYDVVCDALIEAKVYKNNEFNHNEVIDNEKLLEIINAYLNLEGYQVYNALSNITLDNGKPVFNGVDIIYSEYEKRRSL